MVDVPPAPSIRLDRFLWFARLTRTRSAARELATSGHLRLDGRPIDRAHVMVRVGSILTFAQGTRVRAIRVERLPHRRGPPEEARASITVLAAIDAAPEQN